MEDFSNKTDEEIVELFKQNDDYFGIIIDRYEAKLDRYIARISNGSKEDREDVLQNVFTAVYKNINSYNGKLKFNSWIYRICHNETISFWRKIKKEKTNISIDEHLVLIEAMFPENEFDINLEQKDAKIVLQKIFLEMEIKYREVLILKFLEGQSYEEISDILKKPVNTVGTMVSRAKKQFISISQKYYERN